MKKNFYGLPHHVINALTHIFMTHPNVESAILYGSRAKGNFRLGSDIDLSLIGLKLSLSELFDIEHQIDDLLLPWKVDLSIYHKIESEDLIDHIKRVGICLYEK